MKPISVSKLRIASFVTAIFAGLTQPLLVSADDTEVFFVNPEVLDNNAVNVLFVMDNSGTMVNHDGFELRRMDRVKVAVSDLLNSATDVNIGLGTFSGELVGGNILYPVTDPNKDVCENAQCDEVVLDSYVKNYDDTAFEDDDGEVVNWRLTTPIGGNALPDADTDTLEVEITNGNDDVEQGTTITYDSTDLDVFLPGQHKHAIGLRFDNVQLPNDAIVVEAYLKLTADGTASTGRNHIDISLHMQADSPPFSDAPGRNLKDRVWSKTLYMWNIPNTNKADEVFKTRDLSRIITDYMRAGLWTQGNALTFLISKHASSSSDNHRRRGYKTFESDEPAELVIEYVRESELETATTGFRFQDVDIPRGAKINYAMMEFIAKSDSQVPTNMEIAGHHTAVAPSFNNNDRNLSSRPKTTARAKWTPEDWVETHRYGIVKTSDIGNVVQEIVNHSDWCGGNPLAMIMNGTGMRGVTPLENRRWAAPILRVSYDPKSVDFNNTCLNQEVVVGSVASGNDVSEDLATGAVIADAPEFEAQRAGSRQMFGLRFPNLEVPPNADIVSAYIEFKVTRKMKGGSFVVSSIASDDAPAFDATQPKAITGLTSTGAKANWWSGSRKVNNNVRTSDVVGPIVRRAGWQQGNAISLTIEPKSDTVEGFFATFDSASYPAPRLKVRYRLRGADLRGQPVTLRTARQEMLEEVRSLENLNGTPLTDAYYEAAAYMMGEQVHHGKVLGDPATPRERDRLYKISHPDSYEGSATVFYPPGCSAVNQGSMACLKTRIDGDAKYIAPVAGQCQANQIVLISDGAATDSASGGLIRSLTGDASCEAQPERAADCSIELARWLQNPGGGRSAVKTHTIGFNFSDKILQDIAREGGGQFYQAASATELNGIFRNIIGEAAPVNSGFVAPAATVSQFNRLTNRDDVYFAVFKPENKKRWPGNLKRFQLAEVGSDGDIDLVDANNNPIFDMSTGEISTGSQSFWSEEVDGPDVEKGGAASKITLDRKLLTYLDGSRTLVAFHEDNAAIDLNRLKIWSKDAAYRDGLMKWSRGVDVLDHDEDGDVTEVHARMGDPLHSAAHIFNYASTDPDGKSVVFVGTNEGFLHSIDTKTGKELFGFIPPELLGNLDDFYKDEPTVKRTYGLDGAVMGWIDDKNNNLEVDPGDSAYLVVGMRRGGRNYYALNVTDPANPKVMWVIQGGTGEFAELGQTWSKPVKTKLMHYGSEKDVLIFAAGYDTANDGAQMTNSNDTMGRGFFVVDAKTGQRLAQINQTNHGEMVYSMPADINVIDINFDSIADYFFIGDLGGQVWRFDFETAGTGSIQNNITGSVVADLASGDSEQRRRFYYAPDVALIQDDDNNTFLNISVGSGWRAHPLDTNGVGDRFYSFRDYAIYSAPRDDSGAVKYPDTITATDLQDVTSAGFSTANDTDEPLKGWQFSFDSKGEKVLSASITIDRKILFTTYVPENAGAQRCSVSLGNGRFYAVDASTGAARSASSDEDGTEGDGGGTTSSNPKDRYVKLDAPGIPPSVALLIPSADADKVIAIVGTEKQEIDFGSAYNRTFWAEQ